MGKPSILPPNPTYQFFPFSSHFYLQKSYSLDAIDYMKKEEKKRKEKKGQVLMHRPNIFLFLDRDQIPTKSILNYLHLHLIALDYIYNCIIIPPYATSFDKKEKDT